MVEIAEYRIVQNLGQVEIRAYPSCIMATTTLAKTNQNSAFSRIASYIFGANTNKKKIAMTAPVIMSTQTTTFTMSFIMPAKYTLEDLPRPKNADVSLMKVPPRTMAVLRFSGFMTQKNILQKTHMLMQIVTAKKIKTSGNPFFMGYNAPWTLPFLRRNEVAIVVEE